jgi:hypothetical protein
MVTGNLFDHRRQSQLFDRTHRSGNYAQYHADGATLLKDIASEASKAGHSIGHIDFRVFTEALLLPVVHYRKRHVERIFSGQTLRFDHGQKLTVDSYEGKAAGFYVKI